jgi:hypothetical protein
MNKTFLIGLGIAAIVAIGASVSLLSTNAPLPSSISTFHSPLITATITPTATPSPLPSTSASQSPVPTPTPKVSMFPVHVPTGWKTWTDTTYNYQISYPSTFFLSGSGDDLHITTYEITGDHPGSGPTDTAIRVAVVPGISSLVAWSNDFSFLESATTTLAGDTAVRGKDKDSQSVVSGDILVVHNGKGFDLDYVPYDNQYGSILEQIFATFRFVN